MQEEPSLADPQQQQPASSSSVAAASPSTAVPEPGLQRPDGLAGGDYADDADDADDGEDYEDGDCPVYMGRDGNIVKARAAVCPCCLPVCVPLTRCCCCC